MNEERIAIYLCSFVIQIFGNGQPSPTPDDKTQQPPTDGSFLTDSHYNTLMDMMYQERQSRLHLEQYVTQLHKRLSDEEIQSKALISKVEILELKQCSCELIEKVQNTTDISASNYTSLLTDFNKLKLELTNVSRRTNHLETDLNVLKNMKSVSQLQYIYNISLDVINEGKKLQETNNKVNVLMSDDMARKQDFLALLADNNKAKQTIASSTVQVENKFKAINRKLNESYGELKMKMQHEFGILQKNQTNISVTLQQNVQKLSEKIALTACGSSYQTLNTRGVVRLSHVLFHTGIPTLQPYLSTGRFTCRSSGLYIVFCNLMSASNDAFFQIYKNSALISSVYTTSDADGHMFSGSGMATVELLPGDQLSVISQRDNIRIDSSSCITIAKVQ